MKEVINIDPRNRIGHNIMPKQEFLEKIKDSSFELIGEYTKSSDKMLFRCLKCGTEQFKTGYSIIRGQGCKTCYNKNRTKTDECFQNELKEVHGEEIIALDKYKNNKEKMHFKCKICGYEWMAIPSSILNGTGCIKCGFNKTAKSNILSEENFIERLNNKFIGKISINCNYTKLTDIMKFKCNECGYVWEQRGDHVLLLNDCPNCSGRVKDYIKEIEKIGKFKVLGEYINSHTKMLVECVKCHRQTITTPNRLLNGGGCKWCGYENLKEIHKKDHETFVKEMKEINKHIEIIGNYTGVNDKIKCKCLICNNIWDTTTPTSLLRGSGCPKCHASRGETKIITYLSNNNIKFITQKTYDDLLGLGNNNLSYDFYLPEYNLLIEYQGIQHFKPIKFFGGEEQFKRQQEHDRRKREYAKLHNINLLEISYLEDVSQKLNKINNLKLESLETVISA